MTELDYGPLSWTNHSEAFHPELLHIHQELVRETQEHHSSVSKSTIKMCITQRFYFDQCKHVITMYH